MSFDVINFSSPSFTRCSAAFLRSRTIFPYPSARCSALTASWASRVDRRSRLKRGKQSNWLKKGGHSGRNHHKTLATRHWLIVVTSLIFGKGTTSSGQISMMLAARQLERATWDLTPGETGRGYTSNLIGQSSDLSLLVQQSIVTLYAVIVLLYPFSVSNPNFTAIASCSNLSLYLGDCFGPSVYTVVLLLTHIQVPQHGQTPSSCTKRVRIPQLHVCLPDLFQIMNQLDGHLDICSPRHLQYLHQIRWTTYRLV